MRVYIAFAALMLVVETTQSMPCAPQEFTNGIVCVCNDTYCDTLEDVEPTGENDFVAVSSSKSGLRFAVSKGEFTKVAPISLDYDRNEPIVILRPRRSFWDSIIGIFESKNATIKVDRAITYQEIIGFGGALTGSASWNLDQLSPALQNHVYRSFYSKEKGIAYNMLRLTIGGSDFDFEPWAYNEFPENDASLSNFTKLDLRDARKVEQIKQLMEISNNKNIKFYGTAWSPPKWMKTNHAWTGPSALKLEYYQTWADYHLKWLELMDQAGLNIWGISTGNEPINGVIGFLIIKFLSLGWIPQTQAKWLAENFGPTLRNSKYKNILIMGPEDQRIVLPNWLDIMESTVKGSTSYLDGISLHWYWDFFIPASFLDKSHDQFKDKIIINTESSVGSFPLQRHTSILGDWDRAEQYLNDFMSDFQHHLNGWIDWNLILDEQGGPNYVQNFVDAPIIRANDSTLIYKQPLFYAIGHFSRFMQHGSVRVEASSSERNVKTAAFKRPDGSIALIVHNREYTAVNLEVEDSVRGTIKLSLPGKSIHTIVYK